MTTATILINNASKKLEPVTDTPFMEAEALLCFIKKITRSELYINPDVDLSDAEEESFNALVNKRATGIPLAYLTGTKEFYGREFAVNNAVLIPRPETELLIDETKKLTHNISSPSIIDVGTGSGCIAITLALELGNVEVIACDIDPSALEVAKMNAEKFDVDKRVICRESDLLIDIEENADIIVANLPYVLEKDKEKVEEKHTVSLKYEPQQALYAGPDGMDLYRRFIVQLEVNTPKFIILEIDPRQSVEIKSLIQEKLKPQSVEIKKDLAGHDRLVIASF